jgi:hypothetical protein
VEALNRFSKDGILPKCNGTTENGRNIQNQRKKD